MTDWEDKQRVTLSGRPPEPGHEGPSSAPGPINPATGMHTDYWVLPEEERARGFVRPYRDSYLHVGIRPKHPTRDLTPEEHARYDQFDYVKFEEYTDGSLVGRYWTDRQLHSGCRVVTVMSRPLSETYARDPAYYGATFCAGCGQHYPVAEFVWTADNTVVGS